MLLNIYLFMLSCFFYDYHQQVRAKSLSGLIPLESFICSDGENVTSCCYSPQRKSILTFHKARRGFLFY